MRHWWDKFPNIVLGRNDFSEVDFTPMLISHVGNEVNKNTCSIILTFDKLSFGNTMSSEAKNAYRLSVWFCFLFAFFFIPLIPQLHKWYENDNNLLLCRTVLYPKADKHLWENFWLLIAKMCRKQWNFTLDTL